MCNEECEAQHKLLWDSFKEQDEGYKRVIQTHQERIENKFTAWRESLEKYVSAETNELKREIDNLKQYAKNQAQFNEGLYKQDLHDLNSLISDVRSTIMAEVATHSNQIAVLQESISSYKSPNSEHAIDHVSRHEDNEVEVTDVWFEGHCICTWHCEDGLSFGNALAALQAHIAEHDPRN